MKKQLLVIDDSPEIHPLVRALLAGEPVDVQSAMDPLYGLTLAESMKPDLILLDVDMPGINGYEVCRRLKASSDLWAVPVIFLTAKGTPDQKVLGLNLGAVDYVSKPFNPGELLARVCGALRTQSVISRLEDRSLIDQLTGLGNHRMFENRLRGEVSERARVPKPLACAYIDLDGFQALNKNYGPPFGDMVLKKVADVIREVFRPEDTACRLRNDDFAVLLPATTANDALSLVRCFRQQMDRANFRYGDAVVRVTCGVGLAEADDPYDHRVLEKAVDALEQSQQRRPNETWIADPADAQAARLAA